MKGLIFTYALTYGGAIVSLFNPFIGLLIYVCFAILKPDEMWSWSVGGGNYSRVIGVALLVGWFFRNFGDWRFGKGKATIVMGFAYIAWAALGAMYAPNQAAAWNFIEASGKIFLPFLVGATTIDSIKKLKQLAWVIVLSQAYVAYELNVSYYQGFNRVFEQGYANMDNNSVAIAMVTCVGVALFMGLESSTWWQKAVAFLSALLMIHVVIFSFSRGGMLALILTGLVCFWLMPKRSIHYVIFILAIALGARLTGKEVIERFKTTFTKAQERDASADSRVRLWNDCLHSMTQHPLLGVGPDHWQFVAEEYGWPRGKQAHSVWLQTGAELGIPGLAFLLLFYLTTVFRLFPLARWGGEVADPWCRTGARMVIASLVGFGISAQFVSLSLLESPIYINLIGVGVLKLCSGPRPETSLVAGGATLPSTSSALPASVGGTPWGFGGRAGS